jgi:hypothetical protein
MAETTLHQMIKFFKAWDLPKYGLPKRLGSKRKAIGSHSMVKRRFEVWPLLCFKFGTLQLAQLTCCERKSPY